MMIYLSYFLVLNSALFLSNTVVHPAYTDEVLISFSWFYQNIYIALCLNVILGPLSQPQNIVGGSRCTEKQLRVQCDQLCRQATSQSHYNHKSFAPGWFSQIIPHRGSRCELVFYHDGFQINVWSLYWDNMQNTTTCLNLPPKRIEPVKCYKYIRFTYHRLTVR